MRLDSADAAWKEGAMLDGATVPDEIDRDELDARLDDPSLVVLDVLPPASFAAQHIRGARNLPLADVATRAPLVLPDRDAEIAVYRPVGAVPEPVLEALLAGLAMALRELADVCGCLAPTGGPSPALVSTLQRMAAVADDICGECVPRAYAPALTRWMDEVQATARRLR